MIRFLIVVLAVSGYLYAAGASSNVAVTTQEKTQQILDQYRNALLLYKEKKYQKAHDEFNKLFESNLDDPNINFYLGRSAFELKKYDEAIIAFERVLFSKPDNVRAKLELGRSYFMAKQYPEAKRYFQEVRKDPKTPQNIKDTLDKFLSAIDEQTKKNFLTGMVLIGLNYDSNVQNTADEFIDQYSRLSYNEEKIKDWAHQEVVILNHRYNLSAKTAIKNDLMVYSKQFRDSKITDENVKFISYTPSYSMISESGVLVDYSLFADKLWVNGDTYMDSYGIFPKISYALKKNILLESSLKVQRKLYNNEIDKEKNSLVKELNVGSKYIYSPVISYGVKLTYSTEREINDPNYIRVDINKNTSLVQVNAIYGITKNFALNPTLSFKQTNYLDNNAFINDNSEKDKEYKAGLISTYAYSPKLLFQVGGDYTRVKSNMQISAYNKHTFTFNIIRPF